MPKTRSLGCSIIKIPSLHVEGSFKSFGTKHWSVYVCMCEYEGVCVQLTSLADKLKEGRSKEGMEGGW